MLSPLAITELRDNTFFAELEVTQGADEVTLDCRPSDAIALAVRADAPIYAAESIVEESGIEFEVLDSDPRRVKRLKIHRSAPAATDGTPSGTPLEQSGSGDPVSTPKHPAGEVASPSDQRKLD